MLAAVSRKSENQTDLVIRANSRRPRNAKGHWVTKLTPDIIRLVGGALATGTVLDDAAAIAGVAPSTFYEWLRCGRNNGSPLERELVAEVDTALARFRSSMTTSIAAHAANDWRAAGWLLERRFPDEFGPTRRVEVGGPGGGPVQVDHEIRVLNADRLSDAELEMIAQADRLALGAGDIIDGEIVELPDRGNVAGDVSAT
jgi:hypothetical protein